MNFPQFDIQLGWVDIALLAVFGLSVLVGLWRGFVFEIVSLLGWLVAFIIANAAGPPAFPSAGTGGRRAGSRVDVHGK